MILKIVTWEGGSDRDRRKGVESGVRKENPGKIRVEKTTDWFARSGSCARGSGPRIWKRGHAGSSRTMATSPISCHAFASLEKKLICVLPSGAV